MAKKSVAQAMINSGFKGFELGPVLMTPNRNYSHPKKNIISLPYRGPELVDLFVTKWVPIDIEQSTLRLTEGQNGMPIYEPEGIERIEHGKWDRTSGILERIRVPRTPGKGIYVEISELGDSDIFKLNELSGGVICTDRMRDFILKKEYTNVTFFEIGETVG